MSQISRYKWFKFLSPLIITALILGSLAIFPSSASAYTASLERDGSGSLGGNRYLLGEWIVFTGEIAFMDGESVDIDTATFLVDGPESLTQGLPLEEGVYQFPEDNLIVTVTWNNISQQEAGYGYGYSFIGGVGGGSISYEIRWRPPYMLSNPDAELPDTDLAWDIPDVLGLKDSKKPQGIASDGTYLYLLVDGNANDIVIKTDVNGNILDYFNAPNNNTRAIAYLGGYLYVYADNYQRLIPVTDETPTYDEWAWQGKYRLPTVWDVWDNKLVEATLVVTADGETVSVSNVNVDDGSFDIEWGTEWDDQAVSGPSVVEVDGAYHMWYHSDQGTGGNEQIGHATSADGVNWSKDDNNPVLSGDVGEWDASGVLNPSVIYDSSTGTYEMWYIGHSTMGDHRVGYATSPDGVNWTKYAGNPVLSPGTGDAWDSQAIWDITVIGGSSYEMWYAATSNFDFVPKIGYACSTDGVTWEGLSLTELQIFGIDLSDITDPTWSPDGSQLAFIMDGDLWVVNADGSGATNITGGWTLDTISQTVIDDQSGDFSWTGSWETQNDGNFQAGSAQYANNPPSPIVTPESDGSFTFTGDWWDENDGGASGGVIKYTQDLPSPIVTPESDNSFTFTGDWWDENDGGASGGVIKYTQDLPSPIVTPETDGSFTFTGDWEQINDGGAHGGNYQQLPDWYYGGGSVSIDFTGTEVALRYVRDWNCGIVSVDIDGTAYPDIDMYGNWNWATATIADDLSEGAHTLTITQLNDKDPNSGGYKIGIDGIQQPNPTSNSVSIEFTGTEVALRYRQGGDMGRVSVDIDGTAYPNIEMYNPNWNMASYTIADDLSDGAHTLTVTQMEERHASSNGYRVYIDGIEQPNPTPNSVSIDFTGTEVALRYRQSNDMGRVSVDIDGTAYPNIEMYNPNWNMVSYTIADDLSEGAHTLTVTQLEEKHASSGGYRVYIDGIEQPDPVTNSATVTFDGTGVALMYKADWDNGQVDVTIDGTSYGYIDMYNSGWQNEEYTIADSLTDGQHTLVITQREDRNASSNGYRVYVDGVIVSSPEALSGGAESYPAWHPSEARVAFTTDVTGQSQLFEVDVTNTLSPVFTRITSDSDNNRQPTWAPGGSMIAYSSNRWGDYDIFAVQEVSGNWGQPWNIADDWWNMSNPDWSPDANYIAFSGQNDLYIIQVDGSGQSTGGWSNITGTMATENYPSWAPDSSLIAYTSNSSGNDDVWVLTYNMNDPGQSINTARQLTSGTSADVQPDWSPDGAWIAFASNRSGNYEMWKIDNAPTNPVLSPSDEWGWDGHGLYSPSVVKDGSDYYMWYAGENEWGNRNIGYATSSDGKTWAPSGSNPVLETQWHQDPNNWEDQHVYDPCVISDSGFHMWYAGENNMGEVAIGKAVSFNGVAWSREVSNPVLVAGRGDATILASYSYTEGWPDNSIVKVDATDGSYVDHWNSPNWNKVGGLATDGTDLYGCNAEWSNEIWQINPDDGSWSSFNPWSNQGYWFDGGSALAYSDGDLYLGKSGDIFVIDMDENNITEKYITNRTGINGLSFIGDVLYIGASTSPGKVYKSALPGTVEKSTIGDYEAWIETDNGTSSQTAAFTLEKLSEPVDVVVTEPEDGYASQTPQIDISGTVNDPSIDYVQVGIALPSTDLLDDDMEDGDSATGDGYFQKQNVNGTGWMPYSPNNLWHLSDERSMSGGWAWAYNKADGWGYNTPGKANAGAIVSDPFNIGDDCELRFWTSWDTDSWSEVDQKLIDININGVWQPLAYIVDGDWYPDPFGGSRQMIIIPMAWMWMGDMWGSTGGGYDTGWNWYEAVIDLGQYAGTTDAKIRFRFDTMDDWMNDFEGWFIDDVTVTGAGFKGINAQVTDLQFSTSYTLAEGYNEITVSAQSGYLIGSGSNDQETITVSLDTTGPDVTLNPMAPSTSQGSVEVSGTIYELNFDNLVVSINDKPFYTLSSIPAGQEAPEWTFSTQVPLFEGENVIVATGTDTAGLTGSDSITVVRDSTPPTIEVLPTAYFLGENAARTGDLLILQLDVVDQSPAGTTYQPAGVAEVLLQTPGDEGWEHFMPAGHLPEAITDQWDTTGGYIFPITIPDDAPPGTYSFTVRAIDRAGNESTATVTALVVSTLSAYNIYLMPEWNLISLPLIPDDGSISALMSEVDGVEAVWYYNASTASWEVYNTGDAPDSMTTMETGKGYWVFMDETAFDYSAPLDVGLPETPAPIKFSYTGQVLEPATVPPTYQLEEGWNAIGVHSERPKSVSLYLRPVTVPQQVWASLLQYDNYISFELGDEEGEGGAEIYLGSFRTLLETDDMVPGKGFWLYLVQPGNVVAQP